MTQPMAIPEALAWAQEAWQPFNLIWHPTKVQPGQMRLRVSGASEDRNTLIDVTIGPKTRRIIEVAIAVPVHSDPAKAAQAGQFVAFTLAAVCAATMAEADTWLGQVLRLLRKDKPSKVRQTFRRWPVFVATTAVGILAVQIGPV